MTGYGFFSALRFLIFLGGLVVAALVGLSIFIYNQISREVIYRRQFGDNWEAEYEKYFGPVSQAHVKIGLCVFGIAAVIALAIWIYRLTQSDPYKSGSKRKHRHHRYESSTGRIVRFRRNALIGIYFGLAGILSGIALVLFYWGIFADHSNEVALGICVFIAGYVGVISGCWWWLKAKAWNEGVVLIGLAPLAILFVPFVRLIYVASPLILPAGMVMMPLVLLVVVFVLPDKSGTPRRRMSWRRIDPDERHRGRSDQE